jgi:nucleoside-diphosphate-sugar epimerase
MKVLLTGASGFIGRHTMMALQKHGIEVVAVSRSPISAGIKQINLDLLSTADFAPLFHEVKATHLLHLAWYAEHGKYWTSPLNLSWLDATTRLVDAFCATGGQRVVIAGTCAEYDWSYGYCKEDFTPLNPASFYGAAKDATRRLVMLVCAQHHVSCAWGRIFQPYGSGESANRLIPTLIEVFRGKRAAFGINLDSYRDFLHASDIAEGFIKLLTEEVSGSFNVSSRNPTQLKEIVNNLASLLNADPEPVLALISERRSEPLLLVGENVKLKTLGWQPELSLIQGLERTVLGT